MEPRVILVSHTAFIHPILGVNMLDLHDHPFVFDLLTVEEPGDEAEEILDEMDAERFLVPSMVAERHEDELEELTLGVLHQVGLN